MRQLGMSLGLKEREVGVLLTQHGYRNEKGAPSALALAQGLGGEGNAGISNFFKWHRHKTLNMLLDAGGFPDHANATREELITSALLKNHAYRTDGLKSQANRLLKYMEDHRQNCIVSLMQITERQEAVRLMDRVLCRLTSEGVSPDQIDLDVLSFPINRQDVEAYRLSNETGPLGQSARGTVRRI